MKNSSLLETRMALPLSNQFKEFFECVESFQTITLFRHESPDGDAYGSSLGLKWFLKTQYPDKDIFMVSAQQGSHHAFFEDSDEVTDEVIQESLAIVCDTANSPRIDDQRYQTSKFIIKIDHHPPHDQYGHLNIVDESLSSCSEIVAMIGLSQVDVLPQTVSRYLYAGMLTDTVSFSIDSVTSETLRHASLLLESGLSVGSIHNELFKTSDNVFDYVTYLRANAIETEEGLIYCYVTQDILKKFNLSVTQAKEVVNTYKDKESAQIWMLLIEEESGLYRTTIRSRVVSINDIASDFGGGGHRLASATKDLTIPQSQQLIHTLQLRLQTQKLNPKG